MSKFRQGDKVAYVGDKTFKDDEDEPMSLYGVEGMVYAPIKGTETGLVVDFENGYSFVMDERVLEPWRVVKKDKATEVTRKRKRVKSEDD